MLSEVLFSYFIIIGCSLLSFEMYEQNVHLLMLQSKWLMMEMCNLNILT